MNTITFISDGFDLSFNIGEVIQENDILNIIIQYNFSNQTTYDILDISNIVLETTIYEIGIDSFKNFSSMKSIILSNTINKINYEAFYGCISLENIILPNSLISICDNAFYGCISLNNITLNDVSNLQCIGNNVFSNVSDTGTYTFNSYNNLKNETIQNLISLLPSTWSRNPDIPYYNFIDFAILYDKCILNKCTHNKTYFVDLSNIEISYKDFHTLFFSKNNYFSLNYNASYQPNRILPTILDNYITLNQQYDVNGNKFNLMSTLDNLYICAFPKKCWCVESIIYYNKHISSLKTIFNFNIDYKTIITTNEYNCNLENECKYKDKYYSINKCNTFSYDNIQKIYKRGPSIITIDEFFNMFEIQGIEMSTDNSYNIINPALSLAKGLPINASTTKYVAILNLFVKSMNNNVDDLNIRFSYLIDFSNSLPKSINDTNNYRYNP